MKIIGSIILVLGIILSGIFLYQSEFNPAKVDIKILSHTITERPKSTFLTISDAPLSVLETTPKLIEVRAFSGAETGKNSLFELPKKELYNF